MPSILANLTPLIPPLRNRKIYSLHEGEEPLERGQSPLSYLHSPFSLSRGRGIQGDRVKGII